MDYVYLDWMVFQYMKHSTVKDSINGIEFLNTVNKLKKKYRFPFSEGHLCDLAISFSPSNLENVKSDLLFINSLSSNYALGTDKNEKIIPINNVDIYKLFNEIVMEVQDDLNINVSGDSHIIDMELLPKNDLFRPFLEKNNGVLDSNVMKNLMEQIWDSMDDPDFYKKFRDQVSKLKEKFDGGNTLISTESSYFKGILPFLDFLLSENPDDFIDTFDDVIKSFCSINGRCFDKLKVGEKIELAYSILDFNPKYREKKINKKNKPSNLRRDCKNLYFASQAKYYVTEDSATFKKSTFVCKALSLRVKVLSMSEFMAKFC